MNEDLGIQQHRLLCMVVVDMLPHHLHKCVDIRANHCCGFQIDSVQHRLMGSRALFCGASAELYNYPTARTACGNSQFAAAAARVRSLSQECLECPVTWSRDSPARTWPGGARIVCCLSTESWNNRRLWFGPPWSLATESDKGCRIEYQACCSDFL
ncbi:hypothetical protein RRG08_034955 [Elysia crispata]|uniref:Uncharacterized protein n=1 Tax=Elysia crispata TaxID=231223 RepID=A0AAE0Y219_9GAST|nr:hypothetical protein RRG08_034955 [Elysia crispata]